MMDDEKTDSGLLTEDARDSLNPMEWLTAQFTTVI